MEDQDKRKEETPEEVEAHRRKKLFQASDEPAADETEGDDVEAHTMRQRPQSL